MLYPITDLPELKQRGDTVFIYTHDNNYYKGAIKNTQGGCIELYLYHNKIVKYIEKYTILKIADSENDIRIPDGRYWNG